MRKNRGSGAGKGEKQHTAEQQKLTKAFLLGALSMLLLVAVLSDFFGAPISEFTSAPIDAQGSFDVSPTPTAASKPTPSPTPLSAGKLEAYLIDVGQGDAIFLRSPAGKTMLIDAGEASAFDAIDAFLQAQGVEKLDAIVATHPHSDHIGAMYKVIEKYGAGAFYLPDVPHTTSGFERMLDALEGQNISPTVLYANNAPKIAWDKDVEITVLSPFEGVEADLNNMSLILRVRYGEASILLTGDAESYAESVMLANLEEESLAATVLKLGHHGSSTSTSEAFLEAVSPKYAVVSVGAGNDYGHPHEETLARLKKHNIPLYRTDTDGVILVALDGSATPVITTEKGAKTK